MLTTNLLPIGQKKAIAREELRRLIRFVALEIGFVLLIGATFLLPSFLPLRFEQRELDRAYALEEEAASGLKVKEISARSKTLGVLLASIRNATEESGRASSLLTGIVAKEFSGITLSRVMIRKNGEVLLAGIAATRKNLLDFESALRDSGLFQDISSPLSNIIREQNINFAMEGKFKAQFAL